MYLFLYNLGIADEQSWGSLILNLHIAYGNFKFGISISSYSNMYMFGTNSICYQRPKAGYET
jgi:hypothetical protein